MKIALIVTPLIKEKARRKRLKRVKRVKREKERV